MEWQAVSGSANLWSWVVVHQRYLPEFENELPYVVAFVQLDEGPFLMSTVVGASPDELDVGDELVLELEKYGEDKVSMPVFRVV
ncbi:Zn-ribbon domain-containing OB-fold protein [Nesterenkonia suensis]